MRIFWKDWFVGVLLVLVLMALVGWSVYSGYNKLLHEQWQAEVAAKARRLTGDIEQVYAQLEVFGRCQLGALEGLSSEQVNAIASVAFLDDELVGDLNIAEITLRKLGDDNFQQVYSRENISPVKIWRSSLYDLAKSHQTQPVMELTEYGPRLAVQVPFKREEGEWVLEVTTRLDTVLSQFSRRESCHAALLIPQGRWAWGSADVVKNSAGDSYVIAAATQPKAAEFLKKAAVKSLVGREAYGIFAGDKNDEAVGMLFMAGVEYQSQKVPMVGPSPSLVLWSDYGDVISGLNASRKGSLTALWLTGGLFGGAVGYFILKIRRRKTKESEAFAAQERRTIVMLQGELAIHKRNEEVLRADLGELRAVRAADEKLMTTLAHQLKVGASGIVGFTSVSESGSAADKAEAYEEILEGAQRIFGEAENLDLWARREEFGVAAATKPMRLAPAISGALAPLADWMRHKKITVENTVPETVEICGNEVLLTAVVRNLLSNAIKYSAIGAVVRVTSRNVPAGVELSITDDGEGFSPLQMEKVFEMPEDLRERGTAGEEGLGLGLKLAHWASVAMGAQLNVFSGGDRGCRAVIVLGVAAEPRRA